jgi:hypothetical protein
VATACVADVPGKTPLLDELEVGAGGKTVTFSFCNIRRNWFVSRRWWKLCITESMIASTKKELARTS